MIALRKLIGSALVVTMLLAVLLPLAPSLGVSVAKSASGTDNHAADNTDTSNVKAITYTDSSGNEVTISVAEINAQREELRAEAIAELADTGVFDESFVQALTDLYSTYDEDMYIWLANLYDPSIGGFYYSNSARDNVGFLPDLESTAQALELLDKSGLDGVYNDIIGETLSDETRLQLYLFAHSLYNSSDGYYYHPQWGTSISSSRKGRDKGWGNDILNAFDPNTDGDSNVYTYSASASGETVLTAHLGVSDSTAASKVVSAVANGSVSTVAAASSSSVSFSCESWEDLKAYVDFWIFTKKDSYTMGNTINANVSAITNAGLRDDLTEYLAQIQYDNGLWEEETTYNAINGLMKLCGIFGGSYISFPNATEAVKSLLSILIGEIDDDGSLSAEGLAETKTIVYVYNPWVAMYKLVGAVNNEGNKAEISAMLKQYAPELMGNVTEKLKAFKRDDGGFSYFQNKTADKAQGSPVAIAGTCESDVNSTGISISTLRYVLRVYQLYCNYDFEIPALYFEADREYFLSILESRTPVEKIVIVEHPESVTFDDESYIDESVADEEDAEAGIIGNGGVLLNPYTGVSSNVGDNTANENGNYKWFSSSIVPSPTDASNKVLYAATYIDADGSYASSASNTQFNIVNSGVSGNTYVFEADIYVDSSTLANGSAKCIAQILIGNKYTSLYAETLDVYLAKDDGGSATLYIQESTYYLGSDAVRTRLASDISADEWFTLRIEFTKDYSDDGATLEAMLISTYIDGEQTSDNVNTGRFASGGGYYDYDINSVRIAYYRSTPSRIYLDNVYAAKVSSEGSVSDYYPGSSFDHYGVDPDEIKDSLEGTYDIGSFNITFFRDNSEGYLMKVEANAVTLYYTYDATQNADGSITVSPTYYSRVGEAGIEKNGCYERLTYSAISTEYGFAFIIVGDDDHLCDLCGELLSSCADNDKNAVCDVCGGAAITATTESTDCSFGSNVLFKTAHAADGLTLTPVYSGNVYTLDFWCVYKISGSTVTLIATFESGASYTVSEAGTYRITPVFLATTLAGVTDNTYTADTTTTDKTTSDDCLTSDWENAPLSGKFNVYSSSSAAPLKTSNVTQLYVAADPANASNNVLAWMTSGTSGTGYGNAVVSFNLDNTLNGSSYVIDFDYYVDYTYFSGASLYTAIGVSGASSSYELARINHGGAAMANYSLNPDNVVTPGSATSYFSLSTRTSSGAASNKKAVYDTDTWYSVRVVVENDTVNTYLALRGTNEYTLVDSQIFSGISSAGLSTLTLNAGIYKNRSVIYYDNISFYTAE